MPKKFYTSYFARNGKNPKAVAITVSVPKFYKGKGYPDLAPTWELVEQYKSGKINEEEYAKLYYSLLKERQLTPAKIAEELPDGAILLCYEVSGKFCHRHLVADWLSAAGIEIKEI